MGIVVGGAWSDEPRGVDHRPSREPEYSDAPRYARLLFGVEQPVAVWMVEDGRKLYLDRNANGDLTDDGPPLEPSDERQLGGGEWDFDYVLEELGPPDGSHLTGFRLARWNYGEDKNGYGLSVTLDGLTPMYAGWTAFWSDAPEHARTLHFGGPLRPALLRAKEFKVSSILDRLSIAFVHRSDDRAADTRLSIDAVPESIVPEAVIDWPVAPGEPALTTRHDLTERCCYWEFYTRNVPIPARAVAGTARVTVSLPGYAGLPGMETDVVEVPVTAGDVE
jgi:hypothetical protein